MEADSPIHASLTAVTTTWRKACRKQGPSGWNAASLAIGLFIVAAGVMWAAMLLQLLTTAYESLLALIEWQMWLKH